MAHKKGQIKQNSRGFVTVYLLMILSSLVMAVVIIINAASGFAARSEVESVCALAGRSVLSEYQKELQKRYGIFAIRGDDALLTRLSMFYINGSFLNIKALVYPINVITRAECENYPALDVNGFGTQVRRLSPGAVITKGNLLKYFAKVLGIKLEIPGVEELPGSMDFPSESDPVAEGVPSGDVSGGSLEPPKQEFNAEKEAEKSFNKDKDKNRGKSIGKTVYSRLPSRLLGYPKRISLLLSGGIADMSLSAIAEDEYIIAMCSNAVNTRKDTFLECEVEYILFGNKTDAANLKSLKLSLFSLRMAVNEAKYYSKTGEVLSATAASVATAVSDVRRILAGGMVDKLDYEMYLRILLALLPRNEKLARLMDIMQLNVRYVDNAYFSFKNYAYGFDLSADFLLKKRLGNVKQQHKYK